jgi:hypothetical protein
MFPHPEDPARSFAPTARLGEGPQQVGSLVLDLMRSIDVGRLGDERFDVTIEEQTSTSHHLVTATSAQVERLAPGHDPAGLVEASIRFLLEREPKESIMSRFDLDTISRFFPEYEREIGGYL